MHGQQNIKSGTYRINFYESAGRLRGAFSHNHFNLSTKILSLQTPSQIPSAVCWHC